MALTKDAKAEAVAKVSDLLKNSKLTVAAKYTGTPVKEMQSLRREAKNGGTVVLVVKNRLFKKALQEAGLEDAAKQIPLTGQLMYAFNPEEETAAAQVLAAFAKTNPQVEFVSGINDQGQVMAIEDLKMLADLPTKEQLRAMLVGTIASPVSSFVGVLSATNRSVLNVLNARAEQV